MIPLRYVEEIHKRLAIRYGSRWHSMWAGIAQPDLQDDWRRQLGSMGPENIRKALESLPPDYPPTATAFVQLGSIRREHEAFVALPPPDPAGLKRIAEALKPAVQPLKSPGEYMRRLKAEVLAGTASRIRKEHYKISCERGYYGGAATETASDFKVIPQQSLPPGMRDPTNAEQIP